jgi:O-antigen/teichoic acid export membrane protein
MSDPQPIERLAFGDGDLLAEALPGDAPCPTPRYGPGLTSRVVQGGFWNFGGQGVTMLATLVATPFTIRLLGAQSYGVLTLVHVLIGYLSFGDLGMGTASTRFGSRAYAAGDDRGEATAIWSALALAVIPATTLTILLMFGAPLLVEHGLHLPLSLRPVAILAMRLAAVGFLARAVAGVFNTPAFVRLRMDLVALITAGTAAGQILLIPVVLLLGGGLTSAVMVVAGAAIATALLYAIAGVKLLPSLRQPHVDRTLLKPLARFGGALVVSSLTATLLASSEKVLLPRFASVQALAFYSIAFTLAYMPTGLPSTIVQSLVPAFSQLHMRPDREEMRLLYRRALHGMLFWAVPAAMFVCAVAQPFFTVWAGAEFGRESTLPLYLLMGGVVAEIMTYVPYALLIALGRTDIIARLNLSLVIPYVILSAVLIHQFGAIGAAIAWSLRTLTGAIALAYFAQRTSGFAFAPWPDNKRAYLAAAAVLLLPVPIVAILTTSAIVRAVVAAAAVAAYALLILTRVLTDDERKAFRRLLPIPRQRRDSADS